MRLGGKTRERLERQRARLRQEGYEPATEPQPSNVPRLHDIRCWCGTKIAEAERVGPSDVIILPPDQVAYQGPLPHPWTIVVWCRRCRDRRALIQHPLGPPSDEEKSENGKKSP